MLSLTTVQYWRENHEVRLGRRMQGDCRVLTAKVAAETGLKLQNIVSFKTFHKQTSSPQNSNNLYCISEHKTNKCCGTVSGPDPELGNNRGQSFVLTLLVSTPPYLALTLGSWMVCRLVPVTVISVLPLRR